MSSYFFVYLVIFLLNAILKWHIEISLHSTFLAIELFCFPFKLLTCSYVLYYVI